MDLSTTDLLLLLGVTAIAAGIGRTIHRLIRRDTSARTPAPHPGAPRAEPVRATASLPVGESAGTGRHHASDDLLQAVTYRLSLDRRARARVPEVALDRPRTNAPEVADLALNVLRRSRPGQAT